MSKNYSGSCLCGEAKFQVEGGEFESFFLCHCEYCQKGTGSSHAANLFSSSGKLKWVKGKELIKTFNLRGTRHIKSFCTNCGSAMPSLQLKGSLIVVPAGSLDKALDLLPSAHIFMSSKGKWENNLDSVPQFSRFPE